MMPSDEEILADAREQAAILGAPRCTFIEKAVSLITEPRPGYAIAETRDRYVEELYLELVVDRLADGSFDISDGKLQQAYQAASFQSSCGITTEAIWRAAGVDDARLYLWYPDRAQKGGTYYAVSLEKDIAETHGAWRSGIPWVEGTPLPMPGDAPIIGLMSDPSFTRGGGFAGEHELTIVSTLGGYYHSVDGGQPHIDLRTRCLVEVWTAERSGARTGELWMGQVDRKTGECALGHDGRPLSGRRVVGFTDASLLPLVREPSCGGFLSSLRNPWKVAAYVGAGAALLAAVYALTRRKGR